MEYRCRGKAPALCAHISALSLIPGLKVEVFTRIYILGTKAKQFFSLLVQAFDKSFVSSP
jgi:hypothetical protein